MKLNFKNQFSPSIRNRNHVDILYLPRCNGEHRYPETCRRRKVQSRRVLCDNCELTAFKAKSKHICPPTSRKRETRRGPSQWPREHSRYVDERNRERGTNEEKRQREGKRERNRDERARLTISNLTLLTKGDVVRNLLTAVNIFPSNVTALPASCPCEHPGPMSAPSPGLGNNSRQLPDPRSLFFSSSRGPSWLCSSFVHRRTLNDRA